MDKRCSQMIFIHDDVGHNVGYDVNDNASHDVKDVSHNT
jgi:hypothetical protein